MKALFFNNNKKSIWFRGKDSERGESAKYVSCSSSFCCNLNFCHKSIKFFLHTCSKPETWNTLVQRTVSVHTQHLSQWSSYNFLARTGTASLSVFSTSVSTSGKFSTEGFFVPGFFFFSWARMVDRNWPLWSVYSAEIGPSPRHLLWLIVTVNLGSLKSFDCDNIHYKPTVKASLPALW